ncbi:MAG TPA: respiratory nitrate reductase subunit gamma [Candidatus Acidoferrales bacterium]|nr:respiratory nitrate reductase subunit gamma [Candidatus Acidoferrales bacterium]
MALLLSIAAYACLLCFVLGCVRRVRQYASTPKHLRWELYPVPHQPWQQARHGGSYFEQSEWWRNPRRKNRIGELRVMLEEVVTLKSVRLANRNLWWRSQLFHLGLYCLVTAFVLTLLSDVTGATPRSGPVAWFGRLGLLLMFIGSCALLWKRMRDPELLNSTHSSDFIQLGLVVLGTALMLTGSLSASAPSALVLIHALATGEHISMPFTFALGVLIALAVVAYIPYSRMAHFIAKYFAYHQVRWDDEPLQGPKLKSVFAQNLRYSPTWSAPHILGDGKRTWSEISRENPASLPGAGK